jgi:hypothetical protein
MKNATIISLLIFYFFLSCTVKTDRHAGFAFSKDTMRSSVPPASLKLDRFYKKYLDANGIPVISSWRVPDSALRQARRIIIYMTQVLPKPVYEKLVASKVRVAVMARYEGTTDIPEHKYLEKDTIVNWDVRARGLGGDMELPLTTCAEENLLCYQIDKYHAEDILIHEFAHTIHLVGIVQVDSYINSRLRQALNSAISAGKWKNTYAATNIEEYWAEGVQDWFNVNAEVAVPDGKHCFVNTRKELKEYDPQLYAILKSYYPETTDIISCHAVPYDNE